MKKMLLIAGLLVLTTSVSAQTSAPNTFEAAKYPFVSGDLVTAIGTNKMPASALDTLFHQPTTSNVPVTYGEGSVQDDNAYPALAMKSLQFPNR